MKRPTRIAFWLASLGLWLSSCREVTLLDRSYQRLYIDNFSAPTRSRLAARQKYPSNMTLRMSGTISQPVFISVYYLEAGQQKYPALQDTLAAGTYADRQLSQDFYSREEIELQITSAPGTSGSLKMEWYCQ